MCIPKQCLLTVLVELVFVDLWGISSWRVHNCQTCEVLLLYPSCRERCFASGTLTVWL